MGEPRYGHVCYGIQPVKGQAETLAELAFEDPAPGPAVPPLPVGRAAAGAGIVAASVPETEWDETEWKLGTLRDALAEVRG